MNNINIDNEYVNTSIKYTVKRLEYLKTKTQSINNSLKLIDGRIERANKDAELSIKNLEDNLEKLKADIIAKRNRSITMLELQKKNKIEHRDVVILSDPNLKERLEELKSTLEDNNMNNISYSIDTSNCSISFKLC